MTGPLPSAVAMIRSPPTCTFTVASLITDAVAPVLDDDPVGLQLERGVGGRPGSSSRISSSNEASAASYDQPAASAP